MKERIVLYEQFKKTYSDQVAESQKQSARSHLALPLNLAIILPWTLGMRNKLGQSTFKNEVCAPLVECVRISNVCPLR